MATIISRKWNYTISRSFFEMVSLPYQFLIIIIIIIPINFPYQPTNIRGNRGGNVATMTSTMVRPRKKKKKKKGRGRKKKRYRVYVRFLRVRRCSPWKFHSAVHVGIIWKIRIGKIKEIFSNGVVNLSRTLPWTRTTVKRVNGLKSGCTADVENC